MNISKIKIKNIIKECFLEAIYKDFRFRDTLLNVPKYIKEHPTFEQNYSNFKKKFIKITNQFDKVLQEAHKLTDQLESKKDISADDKIIRINESVDKNFQKAIDYILSERSKLVRFMEQEIIIQKWAEEEQQKIKSKDPRYGGGPVKVKLNLTLLERISNKVDSYISLKKKLLQTETNLFKKNSLNIIYTIINAIKELIIWMCTFVPLFLKNLKETLSMKIIPMFKQLFTTIGMYFKKYSLKLYSTLISLIKWKKKI